jgi:hypothetical protein
VTITAITKGATVKIGQDRRPMPSSHASSSEVPFAKKTERPKVAPIGSHLLPPAEREPRDKIVKAMVEKLGESHLPPEELQATLQATLGELYHSPNQLLTLQTPGRPDRVVKGLSTPQVRALNVLNFSKSGNDGRQFKSVFAEALLTKINTPPSPKGSEIVSNFLKLRDQAREEARQAFPNDRRKAATRESALMRERLFLMNNPGTKPPRGVPVNRCSVIIRRSTGPNGIGERVVGLIPTERVGKGRNPIPLQREVPRGSTDVTYIYGGI